MIVCQRGHEFDNFFMSIKCCLLNWSLSIIIWGIRIFCQRGQKFNNFGMAITCCPINWSLWKLSGALGLSIKGAKNLTISVCPWNATRLIGVSLHILIRIIRVVSHGSQDFDNFYISITRAFQYFLPELILGSRTGITWKISHATFQQSPLQIWTYPKFSFKRFIHRFLWENDKMIYL